MELNLEVKQKLTERLLKKMGEPASENMEDIFCALLDGRHLINITRRGKFTIAEVKFPQNGYVHHFLGISAKNPIDASDPMHGVRIAVNEAILKLLAKFYFDEMRALGEEN